MGYEASTGRSLARAVHDEHVAGNHNTCVMTFVGAMANELENMDRNCSPNAIAPHAGFLYWIVRSE
jgi:hypothetical protein